MDHCRLWRHLGNGAIKTEAILCGCADLELFCYMERPVDGSLPSEQRAGGVDVFAGAHPSSLSYLTVLGLEKGPGEQVEENLLSAHILFIHVCPSDV